MHTLQIFTSTVAWLIFLISIISNAILVTALIKNFKTPSRGYLCLMLNLAVADLLLVITAIPFNFIEELKKPVFPFGHFLCKALWPFQTTVLITAILTVVTVSIQRYLMIVQTSTMLQTTTVPAIILILFVLWGLPVAAAAVPLASCLELSDDGVCHESWSKQHVKFFTVYLTAIQYVLPLAIIAWCNGKAVLEMKKHEVYRENFAIIHPSALRRHRNVVHMLVCIVVVFAIFWFPGQLAWLVLTFSESDDRWLGLFQVSQLFVFAHSALNPLIFFIYNDEYSIKGLARLFKSARRIAFLRYVQSREANLDTADITVEPLCR